MGVIHNITPILYYILFIQILLKIETTHSLKSDLFIIGNLFGTSNKKNTMIL